MNEKNWVETQLDSWQPRRPSARIKRRLFPAASASRELVRWLNWLAPATVCMLVALAAFRQEDGGASASSRPESLTAMILSNRSDVAYLPGGSSQVEQNLLPATFEFTNRNGSTSTMGFTPFTKAND
jgi:hypothetical protein